MLPARSRLVPVLRSKGEKAHKRGGHSTSKHRQAFVHDLICLVGVPRDEVAQRRGAPEQRHLMGER